MFRAIILPSSGALDCVLQLVLLKTGKIQGGSNMTGTHAACLSRNQSRSYLNHLVIAWNMLSWLDLLIGRYCCI